MILKKGVRYCNFISHFSQRGCQAEDLCDAKLHALTSELVAARKQIVALENLIKEDGVEREGDTDAEDFPVFCQKQPSTPDKHCCDEFSAGGRAGMVTNTLQKFQRYTPAAIR